ncbi:hypothetical protein [Mycolicibacterium porcinum]|uniref:hypothetical protein n=1 Tax=Mycolicibacterium porcinum TaxID=39693 RepID=UPI001644A958|nr:hypothetical protein [Mycolicibacterium porcinum]
MRTVLGLSVTSHGIAWALIDGDGSSGDVTPLDDDAFEVEFADQRAARAAAAARSARAIAASSGQDVAAIGVAWHGLGADDGGDRLTELLDRLAAAGFDDVRVVAEHAGTDELDDDAQVRDAQAAARAVATNAVAPAPKPTGYRPPAPCTHRAARVVAAAAATVAAGMLTVGSQFTEPAPIPAADESDITAAAVPAPRVVTVAAPRLPERAVTTPPSEARTLEQVAGPVEQAPAAEPVVAAHVTSAEPVAPLPRAQPVAAVQTVVPQPVSVVQLAVPAQAPASSNVQAQPPAGVSAAHLPAAQPHLPAAETHVAADPSPGPAVAPAAPAPSAVPASAPAPALAPAPMPAAVSAPVPTPAPAPATPADPISGWLLAAMP